MPRAPTFGLLVWLVGCSAATTEPAPAPSSSAEAPVEISVTPKRSPKPCGGPSGGAVGRPLIARDTPGNGPGYERFVPPAGFQAVPLSSIAPDGDNDSTVLHYFALEPSKDRVALFTWERQEPYAAAVLDVLRHAAGQIPKGEFERIVVERFSGLDIGASDEDRAWRHAFNVFVAWTDKRGRDAVEWAYVMKGCEREEVYERFIHDGNVIWQISVLVQPSVEDEPLGVWLASAFDAPMAMPIPEGRKNLMGDKTVR